MAGKKENGRENCGVNVFLVDCLAVAFLPLLRVDIDSPDRGAWHKDFGRTQGSGTSISFDAEKLLAIRKCSMANEIYKRFDAYFGSRNRERAIFLIFAISFMARFCFHLDKLVK